jgi:hypothetical protein
MTEKTIEQIQSILKELNNWKGTDISINKQEKDDIDRNSLSLEDVEIVHQVRDEDDYVDPYTIQLKGTGTVVYPNGTSPLPLNSYELPIRQLLSAEVSQGFLTIKTDRATYILKNK